MYFELSDNSCLSMSKTLNLNKINKAPFLRISTNSFFGKLTI